MTLSQAGQAALAAITATATDELEKLEDYWRDQVEEPEPPDPEPEPEPDDEITTIGMSAPANLWDQRLADVGEAGITARRIFCQLTSNGRDQADLVTEASHDEMLPCVSYKVPSVASAINGSYDSWAANAAEFLDSFDHAILVAIWHEPHGDMTPAEFVKMQERLIPIFKGVGKLRVGCLLNGWLLDRKVSEFKSYLNQKTFDMYDFMGIDTYQPPDADADTIPGDRVDPLIEVNASFGDRDKPIVIGEYNGLDADAIRRSGEKFLATPQVRVAYMWNSNTGGAHGFPLEGDRLEAFKATKADDRARQSWAI